MTHPRIIFAPDEGGGSAVAEVQAGEPVQGQEATEAAQVQVADPAVQGQAGNSLYDEALSSVPEEHRPFVEGHFKEWDRKVSEKLSEAAEYRKVWEPFEQLGIGSDDLGLEQVEALVELGRALTDPEQREDTVRELAEAFGIDLQPAPAEEKESSSIPELDALAAQVEELRQARDQDVQASAEAQAEAQLHAEYADIRERHGREFTDRELAKLERLTTAFAHISDQPLIDAYEVLAESVGDAEEALIHEASGQPKAAVPGTGRAATAPTPVTSFDDAERLLRERNRATA